MGEGVNRDDQGVPGKGPCEGLLCPEGEGGGVGTFFIFLYLYIHP